MRKILFLILSVCTVLCGCGERKPVVIEGHGDLYVLHTPEGKLRILAAQRDGSVLDTIPEVSADRLMFQYFSADSATNIDFRFRLHPLSGKPITGETPARTLAVSDLHGCLDAFVAIMRGNGVIDDSLRWSYGRDRLVFLGDILDRGRDDNGIAWLLYKLELEAAAQGGQVVFLPGNHEDMVMRDDLRYVHNAHKEFAEKAGIGYAELYGPSSELGSWFRNKDLAALLDGDLFVHAGLNLLPVDDSYSIAEMNALYREYAGVPTAERNESEPRCKLLFGTSGPLWYRGLVYDQVRYSPLSCGDMDRVLDYYGARRIIVGHSEVDQIEWRYDGRVIAINVVHRKNYPANRSGGLLIENGVYYSVDYTGKRTPLATAPPN